MNAVHAFPEWLLPDGDINQIKFVTLMLASARMAHEITSAYATTAEAALKVANGKVQAYREAKKAQSIIADAEATAQQARNHMMTVKAQEAQAFKFVRALEDDLNVIHMLCTRAHINTIQEGKRSTQVTVVIDGKSYTRHLKRVGGKLMGNAILNGHRWTDLMVEYDIRFSREQMALEAVLDKEPLTRMVA